jgi:hypothetical protein
MRQIDLDNKRENQKRTLTCGIKIVDTLGYSRVLARFNFGAFLFGIDIKGESIN